MEGNVKNLHWYSIGWKCPELTAFEELSRTAESLMGEPMEKQEEVLGGLAKNCQDHIFASEKVAIVTGEDIIVKPQNDGVVSGGRYFKCLRCGMAKQYDIPDGSSKEDILKIGKTIR